MPALVKMSVGSLLGTSDDEGTIVCPLSAKNCRYRERTSRLERCCIRVISSQAHSNVRILIILLAGGTYSQGTAVWWALGLCADDTYAPQRRKERRGRGVRVDGRSMPGCLQTPAVV